MISQIRYYMTMLALFNKILTEAPVFEESEYKVAFPINAILDWPMGTAAGCTTFVDPKMNAQLKKIFGIWVSFLTFSESLYVLTKY